MLTVTFTVPRRLDHGRRWFPWERGDTRRGLGDCLMTGLRSETPPIGQRDETNIMNQIWRFRQALWSGSITFASALWHVLRRRTVIHMGMINLVARWCCFCMCHIISSMGSWAARVNRVKWIRGRFNLGWLLVRTGIWFQHLRGAILRKWPTWRWWWRRRYHY